jgi:hypothetical protein
MRLREKLQRTVVGGGVKSTLGYKVVFNSRTGILYVHNHVRIVVSAEKLSRSKPMKLYPQYMTTGSPNGPLVADDNLRKTVMERVHRASQFLGWPLD